MSEQLQIKKQNLILNQITAGGGSKNTTAGISNSALADVMSGKKNPTSRMMGHRQDLAPSIEAKMSKAFGVDFSALKLYMSDVMAETKTEGMASGNTVVLPSDINLNSLEGQAVLGHELSHIYAQSRGIGLGHTGLYNNEALERQADMEGMMAARGMSVFGDTSSMTESQGMLSFSELTPIGFGMSATAGAPMQAKDKDDGPAPEDDAQNQRAGWRTVVGGGIGHIGNLVSIGGLVANAANPIGFGLSKAYDATEGSKSIGGKIGHGALGVLSTIANAPGIILNGLGYLLRGFGKGIYNGGQRWNEGTEDIIDDDQKGALLGSNAKKVYKPDFAKLSAIPSIAQHSANNFLTGGGSGKDSIWSNIKHFFTRKKTMKKAEDADMAGKIFDGRRVLEPDNESQNGYYEEGFDI